MKKTLGLVSFLKYTTVYFLLAHYVTTNNIKIILAI